MGIVTPCRIGLIPSIEEINEKALSAATTTVQRAEKRYFQPKELFEIVDHSSLGIINEPANLIPKFVNGGKYALKGIACDGFDMKEKVYELIGTINNFNGVNIDSVIVKQVGGENGLIFTLSKNDCAHLGIKYQKGLQLFPQKLSWKRVRDFVPFDKHNLGTSPLSDIDDTIRYVVIKLNGFEDYFDGYVLTPSGKLITESQFEKSLMVQAVEPIVYGNGHSAIKAKTKLITEIVYPKDLVFNHDNFISSENSIFIKIDLRKKNWNTNKEKRENLKLGVNPKYLDGIDPNDFFIISWDEMGGITIEEYEAEKKRKAEEVERIAKRQEEALKRRAEEEKRKKKAKEKRINDAMNRMNGYHFDIPQMPSFDTFNGNITFFEDVSKRIDIYFKEIGTMLNKLDSITDIKFR